MEWSTRAFLAVLIGGLLVASCDAPDDVPKLEALHPTYEGDIYLGVPLKVRRGDVNCGISATAPTIVAIGEAGNRVEASIWTARCDADPPNPDDEGFALEVELFDCRDRKHLALESVDGDISYERISVSNGSGPPGLDPDPELATRATFLVPLQQRRRALTFRLTGQSPGCRAMVTIPPTHVAALAAWEQDNYRSFLALNPEFRQEATP
ncbi:hypothetical protein [Brevundimonas faecalis]|uniref:DUF3304 domain-containing protein n=1 Tax=Brevundimonas faecalis TaxID=947378 RepID=A0ABV2R8B6_9CAUL